MMWRTFLLFGTNTPQLLDHRPLAWLPLHHLHVLEVVLDIVHPVHVAAHAHRVPDQKQPELRARQHHVQALHVAGEADRVAVVAAHARVDDVVLLAALEGVHTLALHLLQTHLRQALRQQLLLPLVRRQHADLSRLHPNLRQVLHQPHRVHRLLQVQVRRAFAARLLAAHHANELHRAQRVAVVHRLQHRPLGRRDAVADLAVVERLRGIVADRRVHAVLRVQQHRRLALAHQPLEHRPLHARLLHWQRDYHRRQLLVVAHQHHALRAVHHRHQRLGLRAL